MKLFSHPISISPANLRHAARLAGVFFSFAAFWVILLIATAMIPQEALRKHTAASAEYLVEGELFWEEADGLHGSRIDRYADSILLGIAWQTDPIQPVASTMWSRYYHDRLYNENDNLLTAIQYHRRGNRQYLRYWHGSLVLVRPLLLVIDIAGIYTLMRILLFGMLGGLLFTAYRRGGILPAAAVGISFLAVAGWYVPLSLEYVWMFLLAFAASFPAMALGKRGWCFSCEALFLATGITAAFFDFLTTETLTLTIPLLLFLYMQKRSGDPADPRFCVIKSSLLWGIGYAGMWGAKWLMAAVVLHRNVLPYVTGHVTQWTGGKMFGITAGEAIVKAVFYNFNTLLPYALGTPGILLCLIICICMAAICLKYRKSDADRAYLCACAMIAAVPYLRYLVLRNHSMIHFFFTFRAQMAAVAALLMIAAELTGANRKKGKCV